MLAALGQHSSKQLMRNRAVTVAILAQGTSWAVAASKPFSKVRILPPCFSHFAENDTCGIRTHAGRPHRLSRPMP